MMRRETVFAWGVGALVAGLLLAGCAPVAAQTSQPGVRYQQPVAVCRIANPRLTEASGLVASRRYPGRYYTHNDSGDRPHVYVFDRTGRTVVTIRLAGAENIDWEDIALAPGERPDAYDICLADIGDNSAQRAGIVIYRFPEPDLKAASGRTIDIKPKVYRCRYADGARNAEGFAVHPRSGDGYVFSKRFDGACDVYRLSAPWKTGAVSTLPRVGSLRFPEQAPPLARIVTAADISPDGRRLVTRSYVQGWEWRLPEPLDSRGLARLLGETPTALRLAAERQGEAICFSADGDALLTVSEAAPTTLYEIRMAEHAGSGRP